MSKYELPKLKYDLKDLEPIYAKEALEIHYLKHHQGYVNNLNKALDEFHEAEAKNDLTKMVKLEKAIKFNGGGHLNHSLFWENLAPMKDNKSTPSLNFTKVLEKSFGSFNNFIDEFSKETVAIQGSGWGWLGYNKINNSLQILTTKNHKLIDATPLLIVDVWEHAYYLQYRNERARFLKEIWKIIDFQEVEKRFNKAVH
jgi:superoxide dismutase, Fe-Mn family